MSDNLFIVCLVILKGQSKSNKWSRRGISLWSMLYEYFDFSICLESVDFKMSPFEIVLESVKVKGLSKSKTFLILL